MEDQNMYRTMTIGAALLLSTGLLVACNQNTAQAPAPADTTTAAEPAPEAQAQNDQNTGTNSEVVSAVQDAASGLAGVITAEMTTTTPGFAKAAAVSDMYEIQSSKLAVQRSKSAEIKKFAQMMIDAHTMTSNQLKPLAMKANVELPTMLDDRRKSMMDNLTGASDADFDGRYLNQQTNAHQEALILFRGYAKDGDNAEVKQFAAATTPNIDMHLNMVKMLDKSGADNAADHNKPNAGGGLIDDNE
jgi:putative membrane protein